MRNFHKKTITKINVDIFVEMLSHLFSSRFVPSQLVLFSHWKGMSAIGYMHFIEDSILRNKIIAISCDVFFTRFIKNRPVCFFFFFFVIVVLYLVVVVVVLLLLFPLEPEQNKYPWSCGSSNVIADFNCIRHQVGEFPRNFENTIAPVTSQDLILKTSVCTVSSKFGHWNRSYSCICPRAIAIIRCFVIR